MKHIYISPHADDVALSCGGQILANPEHRSDSLVLTVFASEDNRSERPAATDRARFVDSINADRKKEDEAAWRSVGISSHSLGLPEALLRGSFPFSISRSARDREVRGQLFDLFASYLGTYPEAQFYFPAGIGRHVDHLICRDVAFDVLRNDSSARIVFYEDAPYWWLRFLKMAQYREFGWLPAVEASTDPATHGVSLLQYLLRQDIPFPRGKWLFLAVYAGLLSGVGKAARVDLSRFRPTINTARLDAAQLARKQQLVYQYGSQLPMLFGDKPDDLLTRYRDCFATETMIELIKQSG